MPTVAAIPNDGFNVRTSCLIAINHRINLQKWLRYTFASITTFLTCARFYVRWRFLKQFEWDDLFYALAYACFITTTALNIFEIQLMIDNFTLKIQLAYVLLFWSTLWLVKASFLAFCWSIFHVSSTFRRIWWAVAIYTFLSYWPIILMRLWRVGSPSEYADPAAYFAFKGTSARNRYQVITTAISIALHTSSELFIFVLPAVFISRLQMSRTRKVSAAAVFAVTIVIIALGFVRNLFELSIYLGKPLNVRGDFDTILGSFEPGAAVIVCALPALSVLLPSSRGSRHQQIEDESEAQIMRTWKPAQTFASARNPEDRELEAIDSA